MSKLNSFFSKDLNTVHLEAEPVLSSHLQNLDRISNDIKFLEERLRTAAVPFFFIYVYSSEKTRYRRKKYEMITPDEEQFVGEGLFESYEEESLVWGKNFEKQNRLSHNVYITENEIECAGKEEKVVARRRPFLFSSKPLIESKAHIRINSESILVDFYKSLIKAIESKRLESVVIKESSEILTKCFLGSQLSLNSINSKGKIDETIFIRE